MENRGMSDQDPDNMEKGIRFGCGAMIGLGIGAFAALKIIRGLDHVGLTMLIGGVVGAVVCGLLAMLLGDDFWTNMFGG